MARAILAVVVALLTAGCVGNGNGESYVLFGDFNDYDDEIAADFEATLAPYNASALLMEKFPPGFAVSPLTLAECSELRLALMEKPYIAAVRDCEKQGRAGGEGDRPTSGP